MRDDDDYDLFGKKAYARSTDPQTSHDAARRVSYIINPLEAKVLQALREHGRWMSVLEIANAAEVDKWSITPRMAPLERKGLIERATMKGLNSNGRPKPLTHWRIKPLPPYQQLAL